MKKLLIITGLASLILVNPALAHDNNLDAKINVLTAQVTALNKEVVELKKEQAHIVKTKPIAPRDKPPVTYLSGTPVVIAPYLGNHTSFSPFDLVTYYSSYNQDLSLLQLRKEVYDRYTSHSVDKPDGPMLMLSGKIEAQGIYNSPYLSGRHTSKIDLTSAELDLIPTLNNWAGGFVSFKYDNSILPNEPATTNSRVHVDQGFLTLGDLNRFPFYITAGQFYMPFGRYNSSMITAPLTQIVFQTRARAFEVGYDSPSGEGFYGELYAFNGDSSTNHNDNINNVGGNFGLNYSSPGKWNIDTSVGIISNIADSLGMQSTGAATGFGGFSAVNVVDTDSEILSRQVPGLAGHVGVGFGRYSLNAEYITATSPFESHDMMFNGAGAKPQSFYTEGAYNFHVKQKPSAFLISYGKTWQSLALNVPEYRYEASFLTSVWKDTIQQIEFDHSINYAVPDSASGAGVTTPASSIGGSSNTVTLLLGIYF